MKYKEWLNFWLENYVKPNSKKRTTDCYKRIIDKQITGKVSETEIADLTAVDLQMLITGLLNNGNTKTHEGLSASTVNMIITVIRSSFKTAIMLGYIRKDITKGIRRPKIPGKEVTCFTLTEQRKIERAATCTKSNKLFGIVLCLYTGLRIGELLALTWQDVDFSSSLITVNRTCYDGMTKNGFGRILDMPKTTSSKRVIPLPKQLLPYLRQLKRNGKAEYVISYHGRPVTVRSYQKSFAMLLKRERIPHKGFHSLRHTFATRALECGMDVKTLSEILGHKSSTVTLSRYAHSLTEHKRNMMNRLGQGFSL